MNIAESLTLLLPGVTVHERSPDAVPTEPYVVISEITDGLEREFYPQANGRQPQERTLTLLLTLYGAEAAPASVLRPLYTALRQAGDALTEHPGLPPLRGVARGLSLPPTFDRDTQRFYVGQRLHLRYIT